MRSPLATPALCIVLCAAACKTARDAPPVPLDCEISQGEQARTLVGLFHARDGVVRLPNGRGLSPLGDVLVLGDPGRAGGGQSPQGLALSPDGTLFATADFGVNVRSVTLGAAARGAPLAVLSYLKAANAQGQVGYLRGLAFATDGRSLFAANSGADKIDVFAPDPSGAWALARSFPIGDGGHHPSELLLSPDGQTLYVALALSSAVQAYAASTGALLAARPSGGTFPIALALGGGRLYVANEGPDSGQRSHVKAMDAQSLDALSFTQVGKNPSALALSPDLATLYAACSDDDLIERIDAATGEKKDPLRLVAPREEGLVPLPDDFAGLSLAPSALALSPDGQTLYVAAALANAVLLLEASTGRLLGALPTGFRPMALALTPDGQTLYVANSEGPGTRAQTPAVQDNSDLPRGSVQRILLPSDAALAEATAAVARNNALPEHEWQRPGASCDRIGPLPARRGGDPKLSRIGHVVYVLKENKTFDSVFGDFPNADASRDYLLFGERVTPNQHALAHQGCLLDNFYAESEQSLEGHYWNTAGVTTDYFQRVWPGAWGGNGLSQAFPPAGISALDSPRLGFVWDALAREGVAYRSYGEFVGIGGDLFSNIDLSYVDNPANYLARADTQKLPVFLAALASGRLEPFTMITLQYDHTFGAQAGKPAPDSMVADNDRATGLLVEALSASPFWGDTLVIVTEDDPSGAADHVDSHRSFALLAGPWVKRDHVSHVRASFPSLLATWERALGVKPLSVLDASAEPLWDCLTATPDPRAFTALPDNIGPKTNPVAGPGAEESRALDFSGVDRARGLGPVLWKVMRPGEPVPQRVLDAAGEKDEDD